MLESKNMCVKSVQNIQNLNLKKIVKCKQWNILC